MLVAILAGCVDEVPRASQMPIPPGLTVPPEIYQAAAHHVAQRVGMPAFEAHYVHDPSASAHLDPNCTDERTGCRWSHDAPYYVVGFDFVDADEHVGLSVALHANGTVMGEGERHGLPDCRSLPIECEVLVSRQRAIRLAVEAGLEDDGKLEPILGWSAPDEPDDAAGTFAWSIEDRSGPQAQGCGSSSGKYVAIDAQDGRLISEGEWNMIADCFA